MLEICILISLSNTKMLRRFQLSTNSMVVVELYYNSIIPILVKTGTSPEKHLVSASSLKKHIHTLFVLENGLNVLNKFLYRIHFALHLSYPSPILYSYSSNSIWEIYKKEKEMLKFGTYGISVL